MFIKNELAETVLARSKQFSIFFLCRALGSCLFFEQFYLWLPLFKILRPLFSGELAKYDKEISNEIMSYSGSQTEKLLHGILNPSIKDRLLKQQIDSIGWGTEEGDRFPRYSLTVQVLTAMVKAAGKDFLKTDVFKKSFAWVITRWTQDLYRNHGLAFKGAIFLQLLHEVSLKGTDIRNLVDCSIIIDTLNYIERTQSNEGSWGFFFREFEGLNLDKELGTPLMTSVVCSNLLVSQSVFKKFYSEKQFKEFVDRGIMYLIRSQHPKGFWSADSLDNFLKTLGWGIKFLQLCVK